MAGADEDGGVLGEVTVGETVVEGVTLGVADVGETVGVVVAVGVTDGVGVALGVAVGVYEGARPGDHRRVYEALASIAGQDGNPDEAAWHRAAASVVPDEYVAADLERSAPVTSVPSALGCVIARVCRMAGPGISGTVRARLQEGEGHLTLTVTSRDRILDDPPDMAGLTV